MAQDVLINPAVRVSYGIAGAGPLDLVASPGTLSFALNNSEANSAGLLGYYSTENANCRPGFRRGIGARYRYRVPDTYRIYTKFVGRLVSAEPTAGQYLERRTHCDAVDWMNEALSFLPSVPVQINKRADQVLAALVAVVPRQPTFISFQVADSIFPYALDNSRSESSPVLTEINRICQSEFGRCYLRGGLNNNGTTLIFEKRSARLTPLPIASFWGTLQGLKPDSKLRNRVKVTVHPRRVDAVDTTVLFSKPSQSNPAVNPAQTIKITIRYNDPASGASRVGGTDMRALVATTDYLMNAAADGSGADVTANFTAVAVFGANQADCYITNNGGTVGYVTKLQGRGRGIYDYDPITAESFDAPSIADIGESLITLDQPYQSDFAIASAIADYLVDTWLTPGASEIEMEFTPRDDVEMELAMSLEPGDPVSVSEIVTGVNGVYYIQNVDLSVEEPGSYKTVFKWGCQRALVQNYWTLGVAGFSELGITTVLAPL